MSDAAVSLRIKHAQFKINGCDLPVTNRMQGQMKPELVDLSGSRVKMSSGVFMSDSPETLEFSRIHNDLVWSAEVGDEQEVVVYLTWWE